MTRLSYTRSVDSRASAVAGPPRPGWTLALAGMGPLGAGGITGLGVAVLAALAPGKAAAAIR